MSKLLNEQIVGMDELCQGVYKMKISSEYVSKNAQPGQFVNIKCGGLDAYLRRPISICDVDKENKTFDIVFQVKGRGTDLLCNKCAGTVDLMAPLGNPFSVSDEYKKVFVVGGGIGTFPLLYLLKSMPNAQKTAFLGFRTKDAIVLEKEFAAATDKLAIATDDGTYGKKAFVTELLENEISMLSDGDSKDVTQDIYSKNVPQDIDSKDMTQDIYSKDVTQDIYSKDVTQDIYSKDMSKDVDSRGISSPDTSIGLAIKNEKPDIIYVCGPTPMIKKVSDIAEKYSIPCQVSMEQRMGCGIGACLVCACKTKQGDDWDFSHVCKDGPVFWSTDICWE